MDFAVSKFDSEDSILIKKKIIKDFTKGNITFYSLPATDQLGIHVSGESLKDMSHLDILREINKVDSSDIYIHHGDRYPIKVLEKLKPNL